MDTQEVWWMDTSWWIPEGTHIHAHMQWSDLIGPNQSLRFKRVGVDGEGSGGSSVDPCENAEFNPLS